MAATLACTGAEPDADSPRAFPHPLDDELRLSHIQVKGTHNSYHLSNDDTHPEWDYDHAPLEVQLSELGVRQFELDVHIDEAGGPLQVHHVPFVDALTTCATLLDCLSTMKTWSDAHPAHLPIVVLIEPKVEFDASLLDQLDRIDDEILQVWGREQVFAPEDLQGDWPTLGEAVREAGWATLGQVRGKIIATLLDRDEARAAYMQDGLSGKMMFVYATEDEPLGAFYAYDDPFDERLSASIEAGLIVRTRSDSGGFEANNNDTTRFEKALSSGAHFISTDYPGPVNGLSYMVEIPDGTPARCNPLTAPANCTSEALENPDFMR